MTPDTTSPGATAPRPTDRELLREQCFIDGDWVGAGSGATQAVTDPATGNVVGRVPYLDAGDARRAIAAADRAWEGWRTKTAKERAAILRAWYDKILAAQEDLAQLMTAEQGKPLVESRGETAYGASFVEWFAEQAKRVDGDIIPNHSQSVRVLVTKQPVGVTAAITPWNFPLAMITRKCAPALAAGCPVVVKPAPQTPLTALALAKLAERAGIPPGVFNIVCGEEASIGRELTQNPAVRKVTFTGSTEVGKLLMQQSASTVKKVSLELGGNAPFIVFDDADVDAAVDGAMTAKYRNTGQTCVCANRIYVHDRVYDRFAEKLAARAAELPVGDGRTDGVRQGPLIDRQALEKVESHVADAVNKGARVLTGGARHDLGGTFYKPTVLADVTGDMKVTTEETFGPVAPLYRFHDEDEVVRAANDTPYGLAAYFYARDIGRVWRVGDKLEYGMVGINTGLVSTEMAPFGGMKESGIGREASKYGIEEFLELKYMCMGGI